MMRRWWLWLVGFAVVALLVHGVPVPKPLWQPTLQRLAQSMPGYTFEADQVVLGLSHRPQLMITGLVVRQHNNQEGLSLGLLRLQWDAWQALTQQRLHLHTLVLKQGLSWKQDVDTCQGLGCLHTLPLRVMAHVTQELGLPAQQHFSIDNLQLEQVRWASGPASPQAQASGGVSEATQQLQVERLSYQSPAISNNAVGSLSAGVQWMERNPKAAETAKAEVVSVALKAEQHSLQGGGPHNTSNPAPIKFSQIQVDWNGNWQGYPWTGSAALGNVLLHRHAQSWRWAVQASEARAYVRRDDEPDTHQAALSARWLEGQLPGGDWAIQAAEWTYTHEDAQAFTFNAKWNASQGLWRFEPATVQGSEGIPLPAQTRGQACAGQPGSMAWVWHQGWVRQMAATMAAATAHASPWLLCAQ